MRHGAEYFLLPENPTQRRYEALRAYFVDGMSAAEVAELFGYSTASIRQMATRLRGGEVRFFSAGQTGSRRSSDELEQLRGVVHELWLAKRDVEAVVAELRKHDIPVSQDVVRRILRAEESVPSHREAARAGIGQPSARRAPMTPEPLDTWPTGVRLPCAHAGVLLLFPAIVHLDMQRLVESSGFPASGPLSPWHMIGNLLLAKCVRPLEGSGGRGAVREDPGLTFSLGLTALPGREESAAYSRRLSNDMNDRLLGGVIRGMRTHGLTSGEAGFNLGVRAARVSQVRGEPAHSGDALTDQAVHPFFAQDHASAELVYSRAVAAKTRDASILAFADYWKGVTGQEPGLLAFDSSLSSYRTLDELSGRGVRWLTTRARGRSHLARLAALPEAEWHLADPGRPCGKSGRMLYERRVALRGISARVRQIAVKQVGQDENPTVIITNDLTSAAIDLVDRRSERSLIDRELDERLVGFHLGRGADGAYLLPDLENALTVVVGNLYRLFAHYVPRHATAFIDTIWQHFLAAPGFLETTDDAVICSMEPRGYYQAMIAVGLAEAEFPIPWWGGRRLRYRFLGG